MNSRAGLHKGKLVAEASDPKAEKSTSGLASMDINSSQVDDGEWKVAGRKTKNRNANNLIKRQNNDFSTGGHSGKGQKSVWVSASAGNASINAWNAQSSTSASRGNTWSQKVKKVDASDVIPSAKIRPSLEHGWNWKTKADSIQSPIARDTSCKEDYCDNDSANDASKENDDDDEEVDEALDDSDDLSSDGYDSATSQKSHDTQKNCKWFKELFNSLDQLTSEEINDNQRQWHCPACQGGPGAIDWYGLRPLVAHAKTKSSRRPKLHRELARLLEEELHRRGTDFIQANEAFGQWKGLKEEKDFEIVWPPMVMIMNTRLTKDDREKWVGMGNQELLDYFKSYAAIRARHSYGPQGHRGISVLIFESSANGYLEAERLDKHFVEQGTHRNAWHRQRNLSGLGVTRQLYGFMASKDDMDYFNQHSQGKSKLKFEMKSYQEMVLKQLRQMSEANLQLNKLKTKLSKEQRRAKASEDSLGIVSEKLRRMTEETRIVRQRTKMQHEQIKEEMNSQDNFFQEQLKNIHEEREEKEETFEKIQQRERAKVKGTIDNTPSMDEYRRRAEEISKFIELQDKGMKDFVAERDKLIEAHVNKLAEMKKRHWEEEIELEHEYDTALDNLMEKYTPQGTLSEEA